MRHAKLPPRRKRERFGTRDDDGPLRCPAHLKWIRGHQCSVWDGCCSGDVEAAHVRTGTNGGMSQKPGDEWAIPLCQTHHYFQHSVGEAEFERFYKIDMKGIAQRLAALSPALRKLRQRHDQ